MPQGGEGKNMGLLTFIGLLVAAWIVISLLFGFVGGILGFLVTLLIWGIIGWIAGSLVKGSGYGTLENILLGLGGGIVGGMLFRLLGLSTPDNIIGQLLMGVVGAVVLLLAARALSGQRA
jgi:uncharacterized membrane protein YeaQ/YmgE (transglycosylase-associated protein family)